LAHFYGLVWPTTKISRSLLVAVDKNWTHILIGHTRLFWMNIATAAKDEETPVQRLNRASEPMLRQESLALLPSLEPTLEVEEENNDNEIPKGRVRRTATGMTSRHTRQLGLRHPPRTRRYTWFCCRCGAGPNEINYAPDCLECYHARCEGCNVVTTKA
jgi:hypothetical protein